MITHVPPSPAEDSQKPLDIIGRGGFEAHRLSTDRVLEAQMHGVEGLAWESAAGRRHSRIFETPPLPSGVERITHQGVADVSHVNSDLVRPPRDQLAVDHREPIPALDDLVEGSRWTSSLDHSHLLTLLRVAVQGCVDDAFVVVWDAVADREVGLGDLPPPEGQGQGLMRPVRFGYDHQPSGVLVEPVDDARARHPPDAGEIVAMVEEGVDEGSRRVACRRVDHQASRFVDDENVGILKDHIEGNILGRNLRDGRLRLLDSDAVSLVHDGRGFREGLVVPDSIVVDEPPDM